MLDLSLPATSGLTVTLPPIDTRNLLAYIFPKCGSDYWAPIPGLKDKINDYKTTLKNHVIMTNLLKIASKITIFYYESPPPNFILH